MIGDLTGSKADVRDFSCLVLFVSVWLMTECESRSDGIKGEAAKNLEMVSG